MIAEFQNKKYILKGKKCDLGDLEEKHLPNLVKWFNDKEVTRYMSVDYSNLTLKKEKQWFEKAKSSNKDVIFGIHAKEGNIIGSTSLKDIDNNNKHAEFGIAIANKEYWGKGIGTEATKLIVDFGFRILRLNSIYLFVNVDNIAGQKAYKRAKFKRIGIMREHVIYDNKPEDVILMDIIKKDWKNDIKTI